METLIFPSLILDTADMTRKDSVLKVQFGDQYRQIVQNGVVGKIDDWSLAFPPLSDTISLTGAANELTTVREFFDRVKCHVIFLWTEPGKTTPKKWSVVENSYKEKQLKTDYVQISFSITQR